jgi:hypothetical protein
MDSVLAIGPKFRGFKPGRGRWIFEGYENPHHVFLKVKKVKQSLYTPWRRVGGEEV